MELFRYQPSDAPRWDAFIASQEPYGSIHQCTQWKTFQSHIKGRGEVLGFGIQEKEKILAATWCVRMETGFKDTFWYYAPRGPVFDPQKHADAGIMLINEVTKILRKKGAMFWRFDPYFSEETYQQLKPYLPFFLKNTQNYQPTDTLVLPLDASEEALLKQMKRRGRRGISKAQKSQVRITMIPGKEATKQDIEDFFRLNEETTSRDGFKGHEKVYYQHFLHDLHPYTYLFFAEKHQQRIATAILTLFGNTAIYYFGASTSDPQYKKDKAPYLLQWEMIRFAKSKGAKWYDFLGITPKNNPNHPYKGITYFKKGFGGERRTFAPGREIPLSLPWYFLYRSVKKLKQPHGA